MNPSSLDSCNFAPPPIAGRKVLGKTYAERYIAIFPAEIRYAFTGAAIALGRIDAPAIKLASLHRSHIYVRTSKGMFFVNYRSLTVLRNRLGSARFLFLNHSLFMNLYQEMEPDLDGKMKLIGVAPNETETEWLVVSRRHVANLREILGLRRRGKPVKNK